MPAAHGCCAFGGFVFERAHQRLLRRDGTPTALTPLRFSVPLLFVERGGCAPRHDLVRCCAE